MLMLNYEYPPLGGGGGVAAAHIAEGLTRLGHHVDFITTHIRGLPRQETVNGVHIFREPVLGRRDFQTASIASMLSFPPAALRRAAVLRRAADYDMIHSHFAIPSGPAGYVLSKLWRKPHVVSVYGGDIFDPSKGSSPHRHWVLRMVVRQVLAQAQRVVAESDDLRGLASSIYHLEQVPLRIPLGFRPPHFAPANRASLGMDQDKVYAIGVGRLVPRKGYPDLLRALAICHSPQLRLLIVGDGPEAPRLKRLCEELGIRDRVRFLGQVSEDAKYQFLSNADLFVLATYHEGFGIVFQEAMYCGLPIITTNVGGQTDFLAPGDNALLCSPGDPTGLAACLDQLAGDGALRRQMGAGNREAIQKHMGDDWIRRYVALYDELLSPRRA